MICRQCCSLPAVDGRTRCTACKIKHRNYMRHYQRRTKGFKPREVSGKGRPRKPAPMEFVDV